MNILNFPGCCTANIFTGFDKIPTMQWDLQGNVPSKELVIDNCKKLQEQGHGLVIAILTNTQKEGLKVLKECNFKRTKAISKKNHPQTKLILLWKDLNTL